jgi:hypothetical protein
MAMFAFGKFIMDSLVNTTALSDCGGGAGVPFSKIVAQPESTIVVNARHAIMLIELSRSNFHLLIDFIKLFNEPNRTFKGQKATAFRQN